MRRLLLIVALFALLAAARPAFSGADEDKATAAKLVGKWAGTSQRGPLAQEYKADGTCTSEAGGLKDSATWAVEGGTLIIKMGGRGPNAEQRFQIVRVGEKELVTRSAGAKADTTLTRAK